MPVISITLNNQEYNALKRYAKTTHVPMSKALKNVFFSKLEDEYGLNVFDNESNNSDNELVEEVIDDLGLNIK